MDSDDFGDFDDDIADEDLVNALTQASENKPSIAPGSVSRNNVSKGSPRTRSPDRDTDAIIDLEGLDDLPSDAFASSPVKYKGAISHHASSCPAQPNQGQKAGAPQTYRQTNLWGDAVGETERPQSQTQPRRVYRADMPPEAPTHHALNHDALKTWVYPTNLGPIRDYQFSIVNKSLFNNTLVALPTGLGKTFIAATIILNYFRWTKTAKIIFVAPTKPLAAQQVEACMNVAGIPRSQATLLTGEISPALREGEWDKRRLFFMTPQTLQNDFSKGYADPKSVVLLVIDEAHRATGDYAYVKVVEFLRRFNPSFRILALTATPGSTVEGVQAVIDGLGISTVEIRMEESIDIRQYVHSREVDQVVLEPSDEMLRVQDLFSKALKPLCNKIAQANKWVARDPMAMTVMGLREAQRQWGLGVGKHANPGIKFMIMSIFTILQSLAHAIKLLNFHGIAPFYHKILDFRSETEEKGPKGSKYRRQILEDADFQEMMDTIDKWQRLDGFVGHPKLTYLCEKLLNHFMDRGQESNTRAIVFSEYRDSAEEIVRTLNKHQPMIKATIFVGQADSKRSEGMKQKQQIETIEKFRDGQFNVLVATSIGEEGLDIGQVDLIICYDASASPIRMLQRMGRTGRKRAGSIMLLLMKGKEEESFRKAKDNYEKMQRFICEGKRFNFRDDLSSRIIPRDIKPVVEKRLVEIPIENTQDKTLPEPKKSSAPRKKATQKKFHMPDGVITGFLKASNLGKAPSTKSRPQQPLEIDALAEVPRLDAVLLDPFQTSELDDNYRNLPSKHASQEDVMGPDLTGHPKAQRKLGPNIRLQHGRHTKRCVKLFKRLADSQSPIDLYHEPYGETDQSRYMELPVPSFADDSDAEAREPEANGFSSHKRTLSPSDSRKPSPSKRRRCGPKARDVPQRRPEGTTVVDWDAEDDFDTDPFTDKEIELAGLQPMPEKATSRGKAKGRRGKPQANADFVEDYGDDCTRTSQLYERGDSDGSADLLGFVVGDDDPISSLRSASTSPTGTSPQSLSGRMGRKSASYEVLSPTQSQASDEDMPSMSQIGGPKPSRPKNRRSVLSDSDGEDGDVQIRPAAHKRRRQAVQFSETESE